MRLKEKYSDLTASLNVQKTVDNYNGENMGLLLTYPFRFGDGMYCGDISSRATLWSIEQPVSMPHSRCTGRLNRYTLVTSLLRRLIDCSAHSHFGIIACAEPEPRLLSKGIRHPVSLSPVYFIRGTVYSTRGLVYP